MADDELRLHLAPVRLVSQPLDDEPVTLPAAIVRHAIADLKLVIRDAACEAVAHFERTTGFTPSRITIDMVDATVHDRGPRFYIVGAIRLRFDEAL